MFIWGTADSENAQKNSATITQPLIQSLVSKMSLFTPQNHFELGSNCVLFQMDWTYPKVLESPHNDLQFQVNYVWKNSLSWKEFLVGFSVLSLPIMQAEKNLSLKGWMVWLSSTRTRSRLASPSWLQRPFFAMNIRIWHGFSWERFTPSAHHILSTQRLQKITGGEPSISH